MVAWQARFLGGDGAAKFAGAVALRAGDGANCAGDDVRTGFEREFQDDEPWRVLRVVSDLEATKAAGAFEDVGDFF